MIRYGLQCDHEHAFEAWFPSSDDCERQLAEGMVVCPTCGSRTVRKQIMAPSIARGAGAPSTDESTRRAGARTAFERLAQRVREHIRDTHEFVGERFASEARAMHAGEIESKPIYGEATPQDARALKEEGAPVAPLPDVFAPKPAKKLN